MEKKFKITLIYGKEWENEIFTIEAENKAQAIYFLAQDYSPKLIEIVQLKISEA